MSTIEIKYFTPNEAKKTLPLVKQIVSEIIYCGEELRSLVSNIGENADENVNVKSLIAKINNYIPELEELGCYYKDWNFSIGLVDFPSVIDGEEVMLCWKSDEPDIIHYHGLNDGFIGRKIIPEVYL